MTAGAFQRPFWGIMSRPEAAQLVVWAAVTENGRSPLVFLPLGPDKVKMNQQIYREKVLRPGLIP